jgi:heme exporter protein C
VASIRYLAARDARHDRLAWAAAELLVLFGALTLVTGPLWARKTWGHWWVWDVRLTSSLVSWMLGLAYLLVRKYGGPGSDKLAAAMALFGMANVPFIYISVNFWRTIHPLTTVVPTLKTSFGIPLWFCVATFLLAFVLLLRLRVKLEAQRAQLDAMYQLLDE